MFFDSDIPRLHLTCLRKINTEHAKLQFPSFVHILKESYIFVLALTFNLSQKIV